ncbi:hypothetical protein UA08_07169 [Talaromyces atroroseus]|uniref:Uncharacterized protein n=1 Tax=Talaromyces atroroseus TaxID=1441469 RepID=A0A225A9Q9_TALAT|nr:hypothetical protein UA08_07169 [Talaromyces atroroseus]OKL57631.1 hypothetical protein UA08_07169 [Talaromyces atroroseus]
MPRLLPWLADDRRRNNAERSPAPTRRRVTANSSRRRTPSPPANQGGAERASALQLTPRHIDVLRSSRSPPTSPVEAPPIEEYIKEGFDNDDMYIMVEDEFYAIAQQFTRHLHHAEYVKRRKQAKNMNASVLRDINRPTDQNTIMRAETLKRKEAERLRERQKRGLAPTSRRPRTEEEKDEEEGLSELDEEEREDDPWFGTSLHTLMASPRKNRSLVGLQSIRSSTRAAAGFRSSEVARSLSGHSNVRRSVSSLPRNEQQRRSVIESPAISPPANADDDEDDEDDDLEIIESRSSRPNPLPQSDVRVRTRLIKRESPERDINPALQRTTPNGIQSGRRIVKSEDQQTKNNANFESSTPLRRSDLEHERKLIPTELARSEPRPRKRILLDEMDDVVTVDIKEEEESKNNIIQGQPRRSLSTNRTPEQQQQRTSKRSRLNDIPTFLV